MRDVVRIEVKVICELNEENSFGVGGIGKDRKSKKAGKGRTRKYGWKYT